MAIKKSDLYPSLRGSCEELHGGMDAKRGMMREQLTGRTRLL